MSTFLSGLVDLEGFSSILNLLLGIVMDEPSCYELVSSAFGIIDCDIEPWVSFLQSSLAGHIWLGPTLLLLAWLLLRLVETKFLPWLAKLFPTRILMKMKLPLWTFWQQSDRHIGWKVVFFANLCMYSSFWSQYSWYFYLQLLLPHSSWDSMVRNYDAWFWIAHRFVLSSCYSNWWRYPRWSFMESHIGI